MLYIFNSLCKLQSFIFCKKDNFFKFIHFRLQRKKGISIISFIKILLNLIYPLIILSHSQIYSIESKGVGYSFCLIERRFCYKCIIWFVKILKELEIYAIYTANIYQPYYILNSNSFNFFHVLASLCIFIMDYYAFYISFVIELPIFASKLNFKVI